ncbi:MAG: hypothetical protein V1743_01035 [Nanoarchaeota archaeon]
MTAKKRLLAAIAFLLALSIMAPLLSAEGGQLSFQNLEDNQIIHSTYNVKVVSERNLSGVVFFLNNTQIKNLSSGGKAYEFPWDTKKILDGSYVLRVQGIGIGPGLTDEKIISIQNGKTSAGAAVLDTFWFKFSVASLIVVLMIIVVRRTTSPKGKKRTERIISYLEHEIGFHEQEDDDEDPQEALGAGQSTKGIMNLNPFGEEEIEKVITTIAENDNTLEQPSQPESLPKTASAEPIFLVESGTALHTGITTLQEEDITPQSLQELQTYIREMKNANIPLTDIRESIENAGWPKDIAEKYLN